MDDVIGQGREPEREPRPPVPRHWRLAGWGLVAVAAAGGIAGLGLRHAAGAPATPRAPATAAPDGGFGVAAPGGFVGSAIIAVEGAAPGGFSGYGAISLRGTAVPGQSSPDTINCAPSTGVCTIRIQLRQYTPSR